MSRTVVVSLFALWAGLAQASVFDQLQPQGYGQRQVEGELKSGTSSCRLRRVRILTEDPVDGSESIIVYDEYLPRRRLDAGTASVLILPPTGGESFLDRGYARSLCRRGVVGVVLKSWSFDTRTDLGPEVHDESLWRGVVAIRRVKFWVRSDRPLGRMGILGTSVGGIYAGLALAVDPEIDAGALIVAGAPLAEILARSSLPAVKAQREERMRKRALQSDAEYEHFLREAIQLDVLGVPDSRLSEVPLLMIRSNRDSVVPSNTQTKLWEEAGRPAGVVYSSGHAGSIVRAYLFERARIARFFREALQ